MSSQAIGVGLCGDIVPQVVHVSVDIDGKHIECLGGDKLTFTHRADQSRELPDVEDRVSQV